MWLNGTSGVSVVEGTDVGGRGISARGQWNCPGQSKCPLLGEFMAGFASD